MSSHRRKALPCRFGYHLPGRTAVFNNGRHFTVCAHCGVDLLARRKGWRELSRNQRINWKAPGYAHTLARLTVNFDRRRSKPGMRRLLRGLLD